MNCKPGDLAVIRGVISCPSLNGLIVTVKKLNRFGNGWFVSPPVFWPDGLEGSVHDSRLFPIRPGGPADSTETMKEKEAA